MADEYSEGRDNYTDGPGDVQTSSDPNFQTTSPSGAYSNYETNSNFTGYGAPILDAKDFLNPDGTQIGIEDAIKKWQELFPKSELSKDEIRNKLKTSMPQYQGVDEKEKQFARQGFKQDMYGLQSGAAKAGQQMSKAYGSGMGSSMRGAYSQQKKVAQGFQQAEQSLEQDMYGLQKTAMGDFESDLANFSSVSGISSQEFKQGGRVQGKEKNTFLDILSKIPSAGGS